jgi:hypothetical protein
MEVVHVIMLQRRAKEAVAAEESNEDIQHDLHMNLFAAHSSAARYAKNRVLLIDID